MGNGVPIRRLRVRFVENKLFTTKEFLNLLIMHIWHSFRIQCRRRVLHSIEKRRAVKKSRLTQFLVFLSNMEIRFSFMAIIHHRDISGWGM